jgi:hypothetical protein
MSIWKFGIASLAVISCIGVTGPAFADDEVDPISKLSDFAAKISEKTDDRINISGYFNAHYMIHDSVPEFVGKNLNDPLIQLREASLFADIILGSNVTFSTEAEFSYDFSDDESSGRVDKAIFNFNYAYLDLDLSGFSDDWDTDVYGSISLRAGKILVPFLSYNENKPSFKQVLMSQPFTAWNLAPVNPVMIDFDGFGWSDYGIVVNWSRALGSAGLIDLKVSAMNGMKSEENVFDANSVMLNPPVLAKPTVRPRDGFIQNEADLDDNNDDIATVVKLSYKMIGVPVDIGVSWYRGAWDNDATKNLTMTGVHFNYLEKDWTLKGEYVVSDVEQTSGINVVTAMGPAALNMSTGDYSATAFYIEGSYVPWRYGNRDARYVRLIARYDAVDTNDMAAFTPFDRDRVTLGTEWEFLRNVRFRYEWQKHTIHSFEKAPGPYVSAGGDEEITMSMVSLIAYF